MRRRPALALTLLALACDRESQAPPVATPSASAPVAAVHSSTAPPVSASASPPAPPLSPRDALARGPVLAIEADGEDWSAALSGGGHAKLTLATEQAPLVPQTQAAYAAIAELVWPELVAPTAFRQLPLGDLSKAARTAPAKALLRRARVLGDGTVSATLVLEPRAKLKRLDVGDLAEGTHAARWEAALQSREPPPEADRALLASYQAVLGADYLAANLVRRHLLLDDAGKRVLVVEEQDVFSPAGRDGAVGDALARLSRHRVFSKSLTDRLRKIDREALTRALRGPGGSLLVTPKQVEEVEDRARTVVRLADDRSRRQGAEKALLLP